MSLVIEILLVRDAEIVGYCYHTGPSSISSSNICKPVGIDCVLGGLKVNDSYSSYYQSYGYGLCYYYAYSEALLEYGR